MIDYHGAGQKGPFFEGWYLKHQGSGCALALIPAIHIDRHGEQSASLQVITEERSWWLAYPDSDARAAQKRFQVRVGKSLFSDRGIRLNIEGDELSLHGELHYGPMTPLRSDIMGPFRLLKMECSHGVLSMRHSLEGLLTLNGRTLDLSGGVGYIETDRGSSFPNAYLWTQCVWYSGSVMLSVAAIPFLGGYFTGCICAILHGRREYRLATYLGAKVLRWSSCGAEIRQGQYRLIVEHSGKQGHPLRAPIQGGMDRLIREVLCTTVRYRLWRGKKLLFDHEDPAGSFEYSGNEG